MKKLILFFALLSISGNSFAAQTLKPGEYVRDGFACKLLIAQDEATIYVQIFQQPSSETPCNDDGRKLVFKKVANAPGLYLSNDEQSAGYVDYLKTVGSDAILLAVSIDLIETGKAYLYIHQ